MSMAEVIQAVKDKDYQKLKAMFAPLCTSDDTSYACHSCQDSGWLFQEDGGVQPCPCAALKKAKHQLAQSGLAELLTRYTFQSFAAKDPWQQGLLSLAREYVKHAEAGGKSWLYLGGQPGCGKTHLCTAVCGELLGSGIPVKYMLWTDQIQRIKADINNPQALDELLEPLKTIRVLYVDDLFKGVPGPKCSPTAADLRLAFEIFNMRYVRQLMTIISSEWDLTALIAADEGTFSRVYQQSKDFSAYVQPDMQKNHRLREG